MERDSARLLRPTGDDESIAEESTTSMTEIVSTLLSGLCGCCGALGYQKAEAEEKGMDLVPVERRTFLLHALCRGPALRVELCLPLCYRVFQFGFVQRQFRPQFFGLR